MKKIGLYDPQFEHDSCGVGFIANITGKRSHSIVKDSITVLKNLVHRGAVGGDGKTGDGAGILTEIPHTFFARECGSQGSILPDAGKYGIGMLFVPSDSNKKESILKTMRNTISNEGFSIISERKVPVNDKILGSIAKQSLPSILQIFVQKNKLSGDELERELYILKKSIEKKIYNKKNTIDDFYIASLSCRTIVYKGMLVGEQMEEFFPDLSNDDFKTSFSIIHQRYSTNTFPSWPLAQPFRHIAHNGEINTLRGNVNKMRARETTLESPFFGTNMKKLFPIISEGMSDSGSFDNVFELLNKSGRSMEHSMMMMVPEAFGPKYHISEDKRSFYHYHASMMEPWDGPSAIVFTDGKRVGATLDRNGLRPARYIITKSNKIVLASEVGVLPIPPEEVLKKGRLAPGKMIVVDPEKGRVIYDNEIKSAVSRRKPYRRWLEQEVIELKGLFQAPSEVKTEKHLLRTKQKIFGYTLEDIDKIIYPMVKNAQEPISSMGTDTPLAVLSDKPQPLYNYFKQLFAQVTSPPIDPYRESMVMSLMSFVGKEGNLLEEIPKRCHQLKLSQPILTNDDIYKLKHVDIEKFRSQTISTVFNTKKSMEDALTAICKEAEKSVDKQFSLIILSDRGADEENIPIPALLAVSAVHHHLVKIKKRHRLGIVVESGEVREVIHFATLIGYGASAVNPYLVFETISEMKKEKRLPKEIKFETAVDNYITAVKKGLLKIMSKMGVSTIRSYRGAQIFEAVGLNSDFIDKYFTGTVTRIEGVGLEKIEKDVRAVHQNAIMNKTTSELVSGGNIHYRKNSEKHLITPESISLFHKAIRNEDYEMFKKYADIINDSGKNICTIRGLFEFKKRKSIPLEEVEPVESIIKRFVTSAMSFGSISKEAHETMAIAMNRLNAASNSGEGGESEERYVALPGGDSAKSAIKQIASARFGVTSNYLVNSKELQIKIAQGAKPGEGGQLPGYKVNETIAKVRYSTPGVMLISPPPHHDIYSIEDLSQLIYDLKNGNPEARISVKLVAEAGVGTIAAGVAKGKADMVLISGHDGGTGASPITSIKYAGIPWEIGLAETQQTLILNNLRENIRIQTDGKLKTGRDLAIAALLGAEEFGFGTMSLISLGCVMMRKCHMNTCPVGVATQDPELRKRFTGKPEHVITMMRFMAENLREYMAKLGFRKVDDMVGHVEVLKVNKAVNYYKERGLDFSSILTVPNTDGPRKSTGKALTNLGKTLDASLIKNAVEAIDKGKPVSLFASIENKNRTVGAYLSSKISKKYGSQGLPEDTIRCKFTGSAGQSFGAFLAKGITFELEGDSNDYLGKSLSGGKIIITPPPNSTFRSHDNVIAGNVSLFGATSGEVYINGVAGERFAVRNSGATAVVVGVGDHGCEYMTGGTVVILGKTGVNFAAGMSGGVAFVLDSNQLFDTKCNLDMVDIEPVTSKNDKSLLYSLIQNHANYTGSHHSARIIEDWEEILPQFVKVMPIEYRKVLSKLKEEQSKESETVAVTEEVFR